MSKEKAIQAIEALEAASSENFRASDRLYRAAKELADHIESLVPPRVLLPRNYEVIECEVPGIGSFPFLI